MHNYDEVVDDTNYIKTVDDTNQNVFIHKDMRPVILQFVPLKSPKIDIEVAHNLIIHFLETDAIELKFFTGDFKKKAEDASTLIFEELMGNGQELKIISPPVGSE